MGRNLQAGLKSYYGDGALANWVEAIKEFLGSMILIMVASEVSTLKGFTWAISYVVLTTVFAGQHFNSFITFYKAFVGDMCIVKGLIFLLAQFLGAFVATHFGAALGITAAEPDTFELNNWKTGLHTAIAVSLFLWTMNHAEKSENDIAGMPRGIFQIASIAVVFMFQDNFCFSYNRYFGSMKLFKSSGAVALWGAVACIFTHVKSQVMGVSDKWFWE